MLLARAAHFKALLALELSRSGPRSFGNRLRQLSHRITLLAIPPTLFKDAASAPSSVSPSAKVVPADFVVPSDKALGGPQAVAGLIHDLRAELRAENVQLRSEIAAIVEALKTANLKAS